MGWLYGFIEDIGRIMGWLYGFIVSLVSLVFRFTSAFVFLPYRAGFSLCTCSFTVGKKEASFSMTIGNEELMHECFPKHLSMGTARMK